MTDLEKLWDDLPSRQAPVDHILREGRLEAQARRQGYMSRPILAVGVAIAVIGAFVAGTQIGPAGPSATVRADVRPAAFQADLDPASSCDELLTSYQDRGLAQVTEWGWYRSWAYAIEDQAFNLSQRMAGIKALPQRASATGTNVQETEVDEPDTVKSDGSRVVRLRGDYLEVHDTTGAQVREVSRLHLPKLDEGEILLDGDTVVAIGSDRVSPVDEMSGRHRGSRVFTISLADNTTPVIVSDVAYSSRVISVRQHGSTVRLVLSNGLPTLDFIPTRVLDGPDVSAEDALAINRQAISATSIDDWLPTYDTGDGPQRLVDCTDVAIPPDELGLDTISVVGINTADATEPRAIGLAGATSIAYESDNRLYLAASAGAGSCMECRVDATIGRGPSDGTSHVFEFDLDGTSATHVASGVIEGTIADRWSMDEADNVLRVALGPSSETGRFNSLVTLRRSGTDLAEIGRVDGLGPNEQIKSVRWFDDLAIVVTFRQVDPLYSVDLAEPSDPRLVGELKIPGYSEYLHPLNGNQLLGIGYDGRGRDAQIATFDISDLTAVKRNDVLTYSATQSIATTDPRAFTWLPDRSTVLTVVRKKDVISLASITVADGRLTSKLTPVEYGEDASLVRTIELADERIVLITGEDVTFFDLP